MKTRQPSRTGAASDKAIVVVLGAHRSGTSALTRGLQTLGVDLGDHLMRAVPGNNDKGFFEDLDIYRFNEGLLKQAGAHWHRLQPIEAAVWTRPEFAAQRAEAAALLSRKRRAGAVFGFKDPRCAPLLPFWQGVFAELGLAPRYVISVRNPLESAQSLAARDGFPLAKGLLLWTSHMRDGVRGSAGAPRAFVSFERLLSDPRWELRRVSGALGLPSANLAALRAFTGEFLETGLRRNVVADAELARRPDVPQATAELYTLLNALAGEDGGEIDAKAWRAVERRWAELAPLLPAFDTMDADRRAAETNAAAARAEAAAASAQTAADLAAAGAELAALRAETAASSEASASAIASLTKTLAITEAKLRQAEAALGRSAQRDTAIAQAAEVAGAERDSLAASLAAATETLNQAAADIHALAAARDAAKAEAAQAAAHAASEAARAGEVEARLNRLKAALTGGGAPALAQASAVAAAETPIVDAAQLNALFDARYYLNSQPPGAAHEESALLHYLSQSPGRGHNPNPLFDGDWYLAQHPDAAGCNPLVHYLNVGSAAGYRPHPLFDARFYRERYPDIVAAGIDPLTHYLARGHEEQRQPHPLFDAVWYRESYPDIAAARVNPLIHYIETGWREGREPGPQFDAAWYLEQNPDVRAAGINPLLHYVCHGAAEGRQPKPSPEPAQVEPAAAPAALLAAPAEAAIDAPAERARQFFDADFYARTNPDLVGEADLFTHFLQVGWAEHRDPCADFSVRFYLTAHGDVARSGANPFVHYHDVGKLEGRAILPSELKPPRLSAGELRAPRTGVVAMIKNEADIVEAFVSHALALFDAIVLIDHGSEDGTREYLQAVSERYPNVAVYDLKEPSYVQALTMNFIVDAAPLLRDVDWVFPLDADEFLPFADRAGFHAALVRHAETTIVEMPWRNVAPVRFWEGRTELSPATEVLWPLQRSPYKKVAFQPRLLKGLSYWIDQGNHALLNHRRGEPMRAAPAGFDLMHLPVRSETQLLLKLNQGVLSYLQLGHTRDKALGSHWFKIMSAINGQRLTPDLMHGVVAHYGEDRPIEALAAETLSARCERRSFGAAMAAVRAPALGRFNIGELLLRLGGHFAAVGEVANDRKAPSRLELRQGNEIHAAAYDGTGEYPALPAHSPSVSQSNAANDLRFLADFVRPSYWEIEHLTPSAWTGHLPFMYCLATMLRPRRFVELGSHFGASFFAYCQAAKRGSFPTQALAVDCWEGDVHAGFYDTSVFDQFKFVLKNYESIGSYLRMYFSEAAQLFENGAVDLLHIDGLHTYEAVKEDYETWLPKMSNRGVIIMHDINVHERDFGVWRLWKELRQRHPAMEFRHSHGLGVLYVGEPCGSDIERLIGLAQTSDEAHDFLQQHFEEVAQKSTELFLKRWELANRDAQMQAVGQNGEDLTRARQEIAAARRENEELKKLVRLKA